MNGNNQVDQVKIIGEIKVNELSLLQEKLQNHQNIFLQKKLNIDKENLSKTKREKELNFELNSLFEKNNYLSNEIETQRIDINNLNVRSTKTNNQICDIDRKIEDYENSNTKCFEDVNLFE